MVSLSKDLWYWRAPLQGEGPKLAGSSPGWTLPCSSPESCEQRLCSQAKQRGNQHPQMSFFKKHFTERSCFPPSEHYATVALTFQDLAAQSELELECKGVPVAHEESTRQCWKKQYFEEIHLLLQQSKDNME